MALDEAQFRADLPEFADAARYTSSQIAFWLAYSLKMISDAAFADLADLGREMFIAHNLVLERRNLDAENQGGTPGGQAMVVASTSVDKVSVSYDASAGLDLKAGHWNLTNYGSRLWNMFQTLGAGPLTIEGGSCSIGGAWAGPWQSNFPNPSG